MEPTTGIEPVTSSLPRKCSTPELHGLNWIGFQLKSAQSSGGKTKISGRRDSNPRPSAWKADALPTELLPRLPPEKTTATHTKTRPKSTEQKPAEQKVCQTKIWARQNLGQTKSGGDRIRTCVDVSQRVYSPSPLATRAPPHNTSRDQT